MNVAERVGLSLRKRNPDVLTCIANLSNDEVFTPPELANQMLDLVADAWASDHEGGSIWENPSVRFLDPFTKSGVFLREITKRLVNGLAVEITDLEERVDHILTSQVFGIATTQLTSLMARRSVYCTKFANGQYSIARSFTTEAGNIWFEPMQHTWVGGTVTVTADESGELAEVRVGGRCTYCGASQAALDRGEGLESHAYTFIHTDNIKARIAELFGDHVHFDVIIGNPPYQLDDGGYGTSAAPIYQLFVDQAKNLDPRLLCMVIPSRWFTGGKGLDDFRASMLSDNRVRSINDFLTASDVFPGVGLKGGVCYFLWDRDNPGLCEVTTHLKDHPDSHATRALLEPGADVFIRFNEGLSILKKVAKVEGAPESSVALPEYRRFESLVSSLRPFGLRTYFQGKSDKSPGDLVVYQNGGKGFVARHEVTTGTDLIDCWKIYVGRAAPGTGNRDTYPHRVISTPFIGEPGSICTETYLCIGPFDSEAAAESALSYMTCRLTRLLIQLHKPSQDTTRRVYTFVPTQEWDRHWADADLYAKYGITADEVDFIESMVRPMGSDESDSTSK